MNFAKVSLVAVVILSVLAGGMAFRAKQKFRNTYYILTIDGNPGQRTGKIVNSKFDPLGSSYCYYYSTEFVNDKCELKQAIKSHVLL